MNNFQLVWLCYVNVIYTCSAKNQVSINISTKFGVYVYIQSSVFNKRSKIKTQFDTAAGLIENISYLMMKKNLTIQKRMAIIVDNIKA